MKYTLGLDIGIASVGWAAINQEKGELIDFGVRRFETAEEAKTPRLKRSARRNLRRKKWRKEQLIEAFNDFNIINKKEIEKYHDNPKDSKNIYLNYHTNYKDLKKPDCITIYHLRQKATKEKISKRELLLCLYNILQARGHFLNEDIDFERESISFEFIKEKFYELCNLLNLNLINKQELEKNILKKIYDGQIKNSDLKKELKEQIFVDENEDDIQSEKFNSVLYLISGWKGNLSILNDEEEKKSENVFYLKKQDDLSDVEEKIVEIYDCINISRILTDGCNYPCDVDVRNFEKLKKYYDNKLSAEDAEKVKKEFKDINKKERLRSIKNINHSFPNGLYKKEVHAILNTQKEFYSEISNDFIEVILSIVSAKIPYYIGPLNENGKNAWSIINDKFKYSYDWSINNIGTKNNRIVNESESIEKWKKAMISRCTYLPEEYALPKGSLIGEVYSILNEINNFSVEKNGTYYLTGKDKEKIFNELFFVKDTVKLQDIKTLLNLDEYSSVKGHTLNFNNKISLYKQIIKIIPELKLSTVLEIFNSGKIDVIEEIILHINLYDDRSTKKDYFTRKMKLDEKVADSLSKLNSNGFYKISKKFIMDTPMNQYGDSMMTILFSNNDQMKEKKNNQETIIYNAVDSKGNPIDFISNRYERLIKENDGKLSIDLLMENGKALMPISRPVIRSLNETIKVFNGCIDYYGMPERIVIETASGPDSIKDFTEQNGSTMKHFNKIEKLYKYTTDELSKLKKDAILSNKLEEYEEVSSYYLNNPQKFELYVRQGGLDLYTGKNIDIQHFENYEIDHILPRGFGDDSMDDKILTEKNANAKKGDRLPIEFITAPDFPYAKTMFISKYEKVVKQLYDMKLISPDKYERLMLQNKEQFNEFINQNLVDTRYIIKEFRSILNAYINYNGYNAKVVSLRSSFTKIFSKFLRIEKIRDIGDQHHAYDAASLCIADRLLQVYYPNYDSRPNFKSYDNFLKAISDKENEHDYFAILEHAFYKAYGCSRYTNVTGDASLIKQLKDTVPLISNKIQKKNSGQFFEETLRSPKELSEKLNALNILNINNSKRNYSGVKCAAVDFYKIKGIYYAIHIPYLIIDNKGRISKEKYITLIKDYYQYKELLDSNNQLIEKAFRFRAYKGDIIYDDYNNEPFVFNMGSLANKILEIKFINIFSYNEINKEANSIRTTLEKSLNIKTKQNKKGKNFSEILITDLIEVLQKNDYLSNYSDKQIESLKKLVSKIGTINKFCKTVAYLNKLVSNVYAIPTINGQNMIMIMNNKILKNKERNVQYYKLKYNILGIRFNKHDNNLIICGPSEHRGAYKKIRREKFYWTISQYDDKI